MSRYIDINDVFHALVESHCAMPNIKKMQEVFDSVPSADVAPVVHGEWKDGICTNCKCGLRETWFDEPISYANINYCPYCGADMRGDKK